MHPTQLDILDSLRQSEARRFNELLGDVAETSDNLTYHLKRLVNDGLILSSSKGKYSLAKKGLMYLNNNLELNRDLFPTVSCMLELYDRDGQVLVMTKLKQPFLGSKHLLTFGVVSEHALEAQVQQFLTRYHITIEDLSFKCTHRQRVAGTNELYIFDKFFVVFQGKLRSFEKSVDDRKFYAMHKSELMTDPDVLTASKTILALKAGVGYTETVSVENEVQVSE